MESPGQQFRWQPDRTITDAPASLVLIHGLLDDSLMWEHRVRRLSPDAKVVTPRHPRAGIGRRGGTSLGHDDAAAAMGEVSVIDDASVVAEPGVQDHG